MKQHPSYPREQVKILLVDDQPARLLSYEAILDDLGECLVRASSGAEALDRLMRDDFAVIVLDVSMPGMDGFETASLIHDHPRFEKTPIIFVTGLHVTDLDRMKGYELGAVDYVFVPVVPQILRSKISVLVELYHKRRELQELNENLARANAELAQANSTLQAEKANELLKMNDVLEGANAGLAQAIRTLQIEISERERLEQALREADRRKDEFLALLAHELRNPLAPIRNAVQLLRLKCIDDPEVIWCQEVIERQGEQLTRLVDDLLDVSRITQGKIKLQLQPVDLATILARALETNQPLIQARGHSLALDLPETPIQVLGDATRLAQAVGNLIANAAKYTESGGRIRIAVERAPEEGADKDQILIRVSDTGVGIPPEMLPRLFELFTQVEQTLDRAQGGLGIGLALVRRLVELHGGSVSAFSEGEGKGSDFIVRLPALAAVAVPAEHEVQATTERPSSSDRRVLVADDNLDSARSLAMLLRAIGNVVEITYDGIRAVEVAETFRPHAVLLDLGMPKLDGYDAARRIRAQPWGQGVLLVALTGWGQKEARDRTREAGFDAHLVKPVDLSVLAKLLGDAPRDTESVLV